MPRRSRRGLSALAGTALLGFVMASVFTMWTAADATRVRDLRARMVTEWIASESAALHHWLHEAQAMPGFTLPEVGLARRLTAVEQTARTAHGDRPPWLDTPSADWRIDPLVTRPASQPSGADLAHGLLVLRPGPDAPSHTRQLMDDICLRLSRTAPGTMAQAETLARHAVSADYGISGCDLDRTGKAIAVFAWPHAGIDPEFMLRAPRAGWPAPEMETTLDMGGNAIVDTPLVSADAIETLSGSVRPKSGTGVTIGSDVAATGPVDITGVLRASQFDVANTLKVEGPISAVGETDPDVSFTGEMSTNDFETEACFGC